MPQETVRLPQYQFDSILRTNSKQIIKLSVICLSVSAGMCECVSRFIVCPFFIVVKCHNLGGDKSETCVRVCLSAIS